MDTRPPQPRISRFAPSIAWLRRRGISAEDLATLLNAPAATIRSLHFRFERQRLRSHRCLPHFEADLRSAWKAVEAEQLRRRVGLRNEPDLVAVSPRQSASLERLEQEIQQRFDTAVSTNDYIGGIGELTRLKPYVGFAAHAPRIRLASYLRLRIAWLHAHGGRAWSAMDEAVDAMILAKFAYIESDDSSNLVVLAEAALIGANACQLRQDPEGALRFLAIAEEAKTVSGSRQHDIAYHHQLATAHFQLGPEYDAIASKSFEQAIRNQADHQTDATEVDLLITGTRKTNFIQRNWDGSNGNLSVLDRVSQTCLTGTLQYSMARNWAAACGLATDSPDAHVRALEILTDADTCGTFGHQGSVTSLLSLTPHLRLSVADRRAWLRHALYANAYQND